MGMRWGRLYRGTAAELALEDAVAALGVPYRTQFPGFLYGFRFFPDFLLPTLSLVIEVDDRSHREAAKILADEERTEQLNRMGWRVVRCTNEEALSDPVGTVRALLAGAGLWPLPRRTRPVASCLPEPRRASQRARRSSRGRGAVAAPRHPTPPPPPPATSSPPLPPPN